MLSVVLTSLCDDLFLVRGRRNVLALAPLLQEVARRTGQSGAMHWLEYFLYTPSLAGKPPHLVLRLRSVSDAGALAADNILGAALFFEYRVAGIPTRVFCTDDAVGFRTVIAPREQRAHFAERAAYALLKSGAHVVLATYETAQRGPVTNSPGALRGYRERRVGRILNVARSYDETLAQMGRLTRRNLRYYRRHLGARLHLEFIADARSLLSFADFEALNDSSLNPVRNRKELRLRWCGSCDVDGGFLAGLRTAEGKWLSLLGGWRQDGTTVLHWQLNSAGYEHDSLGVVIRSFFLEDEVARGTRRLLMFGGTPHTIRYAFEQDSIADLILCRPSLLTAAVRVLSPHLVRRSARARINHLLQTLAEVPLGTYIAISTEPLNAIKHPEPQT